MFLAVYGDSLSLPRSEAGIKISETYAELFLRRLPGLAGFPSFYNRSLAGTPIGQMRTMLERDTWYFGRETPSCCIIQLGIVDCAPRPVLGATKRRIDRLPAFMKRAVVDLIRRLRPTLIKNEIYSRETTPEKFRDDLSAMVTTALSFFDCLAVINICPNHPVMEVRSPRISESILLYNELISEVMASSRSANALLIDVHSAIAAKGVDGMISDEDGHHITRAGHLLYADLLTNTIAPHFLVQR